MQYIDQYGPYKELVETGHQTIYTRDINQSNIKEHFNAITAILDDSVETEFTQKQMMIHVVFYDKREVHLSIFDYLFNLMFWILPACAGDKITSMELFFPEDITRKDIKKYIDNVFIDRNRKKIDTIFLNNIIDSSVGCFRSLENYQLYLANTVCAEDTLDLMRQYAEFRDAMFFDYSNVPIEDVKDVGMKNSNLQIDYIKNSDHCLRDSFRTGEGINPKQFKEVHTNIGSKPNGQGGIFPWIINTSFMNGGLNTLESLLEESSVGRVAQILQKRNVGKSGDFARKLGLNCQDTQLHPDPTYICDTKNLLPVTIHNKTMLRMYNMRYYREKRNGVEKVIDAKRDDHLIGKTVWMRSPMTCASNARGKGICYRCYGDLAYTNKDINIGQIAAELLSSIYTQILLSAKHLLESMVIKMSWTEGMSKFFDIFLNTITLKDGFDYKGMKMVFNADNMFNDYEYDDMLYSDYTTSFTVIGPAGEFEIHTTEYDNIYISPELMQLINSKMDADTGLAEVEMNKINNEDNSLFAIEIKNNELSSTMNKVKNLINNKGEMKLHDLPDLLDSFVTTNIAGGIILNAVHFEVLLMNQIRSSEDIIELPVWSRPNEPCQILTLDDSLANHRSVTVRLQHNSNQGMVKTLINPRLRDLTKPSTMDMYFMEKPQEFLTDPTHVSDAFRSDTDIEDNRTCPIYFMDEKGNKIKDGRD